MSKIKFHIDDFGLTNSISKNLHYLIKKKPNLINGISVVVNTNKNIQFWLKKILKINNKIIINLHINLIDGKPLTKKLKKIINKDGYLKTSFLKLLLVKLNTNFDTYRNEVKKEIEAQLRLHLKLLKNINYKKSKLIHIDSHQHLHMVPWILDLILELSKKYKITFIRSINEPFILSSLSNFFKIWFYENLLKYLILKILNVYNSKKILNMNIKTNQLFYGVINSGHMNKSYIEKIYLKKKEEYQVLLHPNIGNKSEKKIFGNKNKLKYYLSNDRIDELNFLIKN